MKRLHRGGVVSHANRRIPVVEVLQQFGVDIAEAPVTGSTIKTWCPFGDMHPDGGREREMRVYSDGKCFCHICQRMYDSVSMAAQKWGVSWETAARRLLADRNLAYNEYAPVEEIPISPERLRTGAMAGLAVWAEARGIDRFGEPYLRCIRCADVITEEPHVDMWLSACKRFLGRI